MGEREKIWKREKERKRWTKEGGKVVGVADHGLLVSRKKGAEKRKIGSRGKRRRKKKKKGQKKKEKKEWAGGNYPCGKFLLGTFQIFKILFLTPNFLKI